MDESEAIRKRVLELCQQKGISVLQLADLCKLSPSGMKNILYGRNRSHKIGTIKKLCDALEITLGEFFSSSDFDALEQEIR